MTVDEYDRYLIDTKTLFNTAIIHLYLKGIAISPNLIKINSLKNLSVKAFKSSGAVTDLKAGNNPGLYIGKIAEHKSSDRPIHNAYTV